MKDWVRTKMDFPNVRGGDGLPRRRIIMMGSGIPVQPNRIERACREGVAACLDGRAALADMDAEDVPCTFVLGFAAALDAVSRGTVDFVASFMDVARQAWEDVNNVTTRRNKVTDVMRLGD